ncbi:MAG: hypothetical protein D6690_11140 [Nitrospirae bacterium]|nr:MAG: hypothetical protein D6690_11140 [Nitrospirota bacterium]
MTDYQITVNDTLLSNLLSGDRQGLGELDEEQLGAGRYERSEQRTGQESPHETRRKAEPINLYAKDALEAFSMACKMKNGHSCFMV